MAALAVGVGVATGALKPLLEKLGAALGKEYKRFKNAHGTIRSLAQELEAIHVFLLKMSEEENPDEQDKVWVKEVRELSYDMEDSFDEFMVRADGKSNPESLIKKLKAFASKAKARREIAKAIEDLMVKVKEVADRNARYRRGEIISQRNNIAVDRRALVILEDASKLVGIEGPRDELIEQLMIPTQKPKVLSIFGFGGLGKTTLANQVYEKLKDQLKCHHAFISVSRNPDLANVLRNILFQVSNEPHPNIEAWDVQLIIRKIHNYLEKVRYLIVIDDIWSKDAWEVINYALPKNNLGSIIITTTRLHDVAKTCCSSEGDVLHSMKPLGSVDAKRLFFERLFDSQDKCPKQLVDVSDKILEKCDGVPLALISISGLLANKPQTVDEWDRVHNSIGHGLGKCSDVKSMIQILSLSYFDLRRHLKTCLLYISIFPEDSFIHKRSLIRRWIAEGFIPEEPGYTSYALGERCFNELINRSLIQARKLNMYGEVTACQVHDTILDIIRTKSEEENFVTVFDDSNQIFGEHSRVRRLSLQAKSQEKVSMLTHLDLSHVRSVTVFDDSVEQNLWPKFRFLRVLDLQGCIQVEGYHLADIGNLFQLKYLGLRGTGVCELPEQIRKLQYLETLDLKESKVTKLPNSIAAHQRLVYLAVDKEVKLPGGAGTMTALEDLDCVDIFKQSIDFTRELGQLENLRNVWFFLGTDHSTVAAGCHYKEYIDNILSSLSKLGRLQSLSIVIEDECNDFCLDSGDYPVGLTKLEITQWYISKVPNWVGHLINLQQLTLYVKEFQVEDIVVLGRLPALVFFRLVAHQDFEGRRVTIRASDGFQQLKQFDFGYTIPVMFDVGAMPNLEKLTLLFSVRSLTLDMLVSENGKFPFGVQHLSSLQSVDSVVFWPPRQGIQDWVTQKIVQLEKKGFKQGIEMADMIFTLEAVTASLLDAKLRQDPSRGETYAFESAVSTHPKFQKLNHTLSWQTKDQYNTFANLFLFYMRYQAIPKLLKCHEPHVATRDKANFNKIIRTFLEDTMDAVSLRWIEDNAHAATVFYWRTWQNWMENNPGVDQHPPASGPLQSGGDHEQHEDDSENEEYEEDSNLNFEEEEEEE